MRMGTASMSVDMVIVENVGGNCFSKMVGEEGRSPVVIHGTGTG